MSYEYEYVKNDKRSCPKGAAAPPYDVNGIRWHDDWPEKRGWYHVALLHTPSMSPLFQLPIARMYYDGEDWLRATHPDADEFEIATVLMDELWPNELFDPDDPWCCEPEYDEVPYYEPEYWHDIDEAMIPCKFPY